MADRASDEGKPVVKKDIFELDKDERWQARLDEARARREVALREQAAGKPAKPRPKPWEVEGAAVEAPKPIEPIIQERGDDKFDFADRLESIRGKTPEETKPPEPPVSSTLDDETAAFIARKTVEREARLAAERAAERDAEQSLPSDGTNRQETPADLPVSEPVSPPPPVPDKALRETPRFRPVPSAPADDGPDISPTPDQRRATAPEPRARPQPSLILPGAPDVAELAARYAATLDTPRPLAATRLPETEDSAGDTRPSAELVALPLSGVPVASPKEEPKPTYADRRKGIRPLGMAVGLLAFAALPLTTEAPPLETGPSMPLVLDRRIQPALGVTWSLSGRPAETSAGNWRPVGTPSYLAPISRDASVAAVTEPPVLPLPDPASPGALSLAPDAPIGSASPEALPDPARFGDVAPVAADGAPPLTSAPDPALDAPVGSPPTVTEPLPRPETIRNQEATPQSSAPVPRPAPAQTVVEGDPLRITILAPPRADRSDLDGIANNVRLDGHELVRVRDVDFSISARNVRYFHEEDRASAARFAEKYDAELRDFTWFRPKPVEGTTELWLAGRGASGGNTSGRVQNAQPADPAGIDNAVLLELMERLGLGTEILEDLGTRQDLLEALEEAQSSSPNGN